MFGGDFQNKKKIPRRVIAREYVCVIDSGSTNKDWRFHV